MLTIHTQHLHYINHSVLLNHFACCSMNKERGCLDDLEEFGYIKRYFIHKAFFSFLALSLLEFNYFCYKIIERYVIERRQFICWCIVLHNQA